MRNPVPAHTGRGLKTCPEPDHTAGRSCLSIQRPSGVHGRCSLFPERAQVRYRECRLPVWMDFATCPTGHNLILVSKSHRQQQAKLPAASSFYLSIVVDSQCFVYTTTILMYYPYNQGNICCARLFFNSSNCCWVIM